MFKKIVFFIFITFIITSCGSKKSLIYIDINGSDNNDGSLSKPIYSFEKALQILRGNKINTKNSDTIFVFFRKGVYRTKKGFVIDQLFEGSKKNPIVFKNHNNEHVTICGSISINHINQVSENFKNRFVNHQKIVEINLIENNIDKVEPIKLSGFNRINKPLHYSLNELYYKGTPTQLSKFPNNGKIFIKEVKSNDVKSQIGIVPNFTIPIKWTKENNLVLHGYWMYTWADAYESVKNVDFKNNIIWISPPNNVYGFEKNNPFIVQNALSEIDTVGEWALDVDDQKIFFYPPAKITENLEFSVCKEPILKLQNTSYITFDGLIFEMGAGDGIIVDDSENIIFRNCEIKNFARDGLKIEGGFSNKVLNCNIYNNGRGGIFLSGGDREKLTKSNYLIDNCKIYNSSRIDRTYTPGIWVDGVGSTIRNCEFFNIPSSAMRLNGNDHIVEYNEFHHIVYESDDQGAIDMWGDPTYRGNVIRYNFFHNVGMLNNDNPNQGRAAIRLDDAISGTHIFGNVFYKCSNGAFGAIQIHGGKENVVENNIFYNCHAAVSHTSWSEDFWKRYINPHLGTFEKNRDLYEKRYPEMKGLNENLNYNTMKNNIVINSIETILRKSPSFFANNNFELKTDLRFSNFESLEEVLKKNNRSIKEINFENIDFNKIGIRKR